MHSKITHYFAKFPVNHLYLLGFCCACLMTAFSLIPSGHVQAKRNTNFKLTAPISLEAEWVTLQQADNLSTESTEPPTDAYSADNPLPSSWRREIIKIQANDTLANLFAQKKIDLKTLTALTRKSKKGELFSRIHPGEAITFDFNSQDTLQGISLQTSPLNYITASRLPTGNFAVREHAIASDIRISTAHAVITSSLFEAGQQANLPEKLVLQLAKIFAWDIDFAQDIQNGDQFSVVYQTHYVKGKKASSGEILAAEFITNGEKHSAIRFENSDGQVTYYSPDGEPLHKAFLRTPVEFTHISSHFESHRKHPVLHSIRAHKGVDYAAPRGTPVKSAGDGKIVFAGNKGGYGKVVIIQHGEKYKTVYAHLNSYAKAFKTNTTIHQGEIIGFVGSTGLASGPHLHYEFQVNGIHKNPLTVKLPGGPALQAQHLAAFKAQSQFLLRQLATAKTNQPIIASSK